MTKVLLIKMPLRWRDWTQSHRKEQNCKGLEHVNQNPTIQGRE